MSSKFAGVTFDEQAATPSDDAIIRRAILDDGILTGCEFSYTGSTLTMTSGQLMICGRQVKHPSTQNWAVADATTGFARLLLTIDLTRTSSKDTFEQVVDTIEYASAVDGFADLVQDDINASGTKYQIVAAVVSLASGGISRIVSQLSQTTAALGDKSVIIAKAPTGATVTCTKGDVVKRATEKNGEWRFNGLDIGIWMLRAEMSGQQPTTQEVNIKEFGVYRVTLAFRLTPEITYTGDYEIVDDDDQPIEDFSNWKDNWKIRFLTSGTFTVTNMYGWDGRIDVFLVGGGGSSTTANRSYPGGGGGGYTLTAKIVELQANTPYEITIGSGAAPGEGVQGGTSEAFGNKAAGGYGTSSDNEGGNGGSSGGAGNQSPTPKCNGSSNGGSTGGRGQIELPGPNGETGNTREFGEGDGKLYAGGGAGSTTGGKNGSPGDGGGGELGNPGQENTGGGAGGYKTGTKASSGGSGIVIIRNAKGGAA